MATAPTSIKAYVIPTNGADPYFEDLPTIETPIPESTYPDGLKPENQKLLEEFKNEAADSHLIYNLPEGAQRGIRQGVYEGRYQPDKETLGQNRHADCRVSGEMFCLKVSDSVDEQGKCFYVNVEPDDFVEEEKSIVQDTIDAISYFECYGFHQGEKSILAYLLPKDRIGPRTQYIQTTTIPSMPVSRLIGRSTISQETWDEVYLIRSKGKGTSRPTVGKRQLPELQPIRPRDWYPKEWKKRKAVGDDKYHMFLTLADGNEEPNPNFDDESLLWGDVFILKVSDELDSEKRSLYEDVDSDGELASKDLRNLINHLNDILRDVTRCVK